MSAYEELPMVDIEKLNPRLYDHIEEINEIKVSRKQSQLSLSNMHLFTKWNDAL